MRTVVGYLRPGTPARSIPPDIGDLFARAALREGVDLRGYHTDPPPDVGQIAPRAGFMAALTDVQSGRADGVLLLAAEDLAWEPDTRASLARLITSLSGMVLVAGGVVTPAGP